MRPLREGDVAWTFARHAKLLPDWGPNCVSYSSQLLSFCKGRERKPWERAHATRAHGAACSAARQNTSAGPVVLFLCFGCRSCSSPARLSLNLKILPRDVGSNEGRGVGWGGGGKRPAARHPKGWRCSRRPGQHARVCARRSCVCACVRACVLSVLYCMRACVRPPRCVTDRHQIKKGACLGNGPRGWVRGCPRVCERGNRMVWRVWKCNSSLMIIIGSEISFPDRPPPM